MRILASPSLHAALLGSIFNPSSKAAKSYKTVMVRVGVGVGVRYGSGKEDGVVRVRRMAERPRKGSVKGG